MLSMNTKSITENAQKWQSTDVKLPQYNVAKIAESTNLNPTWVHFGAGNIFRIFVASLQQNLLNSGATTTGIIAAETFDFDIVDKIYTPYDNLTMAVTLNADGTVDKEIIASVTQALRARADDEDFVRLKEIFTSKSLQLASFTITEKGYILTAPSGELLPIVQKDMQSGPATPCHAMSVIASLLFERFSAGKLPIAVVSMDNCSHNGEKLQASVLQIAKAWLENGFVGEDFIAYLNDENCVSFPWSMIDKIVPRPSEKVQQLLEDDKINNMSPIITSRGTYIAPFVNAEKSQYLVIENNFPNGRPPLENAGVYFTTRETVNCVERMKVTTCLNPLHTAMSVYGCLLGFTLICDEMKDSDIVKLIKTLGYKEGLPVVEDPGIISPKEFIDDVIEKRLPNPFMPDAPQRIATDTSQKVGIRFGETIKSYVATGKDLAQLVALPLAIAGWFRYLLGTDDNGKDFEVSSDPLKETLTAALAGIKFGEPKSYNGQLLPILSNVSIFGIDLVEIGMASKIETLFVKMLEGNGAVRATLKGELDKNEER